MNQLLIKKPWRNREKMVSILLAVAVPIQDSFSLLAHAYPSYPKVAGLLNSGVRS